MSFVGSMFSDDKGSGFTGNGTNIISGSNQQQADQTYGQSQDALKQQQDFLTALQGQNGIQNQSSVFNQLQGVANGTGPNPAQAMLNNSTGQNVANQAALMAGQRGAGSNVGLMARQAAQQGAATQQQAVGQGAAMQANQSLGALGQMGGLANQQVAQQGSATQGLNTNSQNLNSNVLSGIQGQNNANVGMQSNLNNAQAGIAQGNQASQQKMFGTAVNSLGSLMGAGSMMAAGGVVGNKPPLKMAEGGDVFGGAGPRSSFGQSLASQSAAMPNIGSPINNPNLAEESKAGKWSGGTGAGGGLSKGFQSMMSGPSGGGGAGAMPMDVGGAGGATSGGTAMAGGADAGGIESLAVLAAAKGGIASLQHVNATRQAKGGTVPALVSPGEIYLPPDKAKKAAEGKISPLDGEKIKGKAAVGGDVNSYANDTVSKTLKEGGLVLPRSVTQSKDPGKAAAAFVQAHMRQLKGKK